MRTRPWRSCARGHGGAAPRGRRGADTQVRPHTIRQVAVDDVTVRTQRGRVQGRLIHHCARSPLALSRRASDAQGCRPSDPLSPT